MNARDLAALSLLLNQHHTIGAPSPKAHARGKCPTCRFHVVANDKGVWRHQLRHDIDPAAVRLWIERHRRVA